MLRLEVPRLAATVPAATLTSELTRGAMAAAVAGAVAGRRRAGMNDRSGVVDAGRGAAVAGSGLPAAGLATVAVVRRGVLPLARLAEAAGAAEPAELCRTAGTR
ncbi:MAG: hypothetical protein KIH64_000730, partial [Mycobacterium sp.]|nr:hypothetical protein [Mycobacterium sp.]